MAIFYLVYCSVHKPPLYLCAEVWVEYNMVASPAISQLKPVGLANIKKSVSFILRHILHHTP